MSKIDVYNQNGEIASNTLLPEEIFEIPLNQDLLHQVVVSQRANKRQLIAHTKDRGEVRGGGRKPWKQKGTGRARQGSIRSPLWKGGGVTFGPTNERNFKKIVPKKMKRKALFMALSSKLKDGELFVIDELKLENFKTKELVKIIQSIFKGKKGSILIVSAGKDEKVVRAAKNISGVKVIASNNLNALEVLNFKYLLIEKEAIQKIKEVFKLKNKE